MLLGSVAAWGLGPKIIPLLAGNKLEPAIPLFQWLLLCLLGMTFSNIMTAQWIGRGWFVQAAGVTMRMGSLNLLASMILVPKYGATGAIIASIIVYTQELFVNGAVALWCERRFKLLANTIPG